MDHIQILDKQVSDMIAAGQVIDRPAAVARELIENSIDAGATQITLESRRGGCTYIRVTDNGQGILPEDVPLAFTRHATSKIGEARDLENIHTLGFRGEALAAIASVAHVNMMTRPAEREMGWSHTVSCGDVEESGEVGCPLGTTVIVRALFCSSPTQYKFLKRDSVEGAALHEVVQREALAHPEVAFRHIRDGRQILSTPGDGRLENAIYAVLGDEFAASLVDVRGGIDDVEVTGFITRPTACLPSRARQYFFVNGRWVRSKLLTAGLEDGYHNQRMVGRFPGAVLHLTASSKELDVNQDPAKAEIRFVHNRDVYDAICCAVVGGLTTRFDRPVIRAEPSPELELEESEYCPPCPDVFLCFTSDNSPQDAAAASREAAALMNIPSDIRVDPKMLVTPPWLPPEPTPDVPGEPWWARLAKPRPQEEAGGGDAPWQVDPPPQMDPDQQLALEIDPAVPWRVVGEVLMTYIVVEQGERVFFIDKHAAHERMGFDALKAQDYSPMAQELLEPLVLRPGEEAVQTLLEYARDLERFGFSVEEFGEGALVVRQIPAHLTPQEVPDVLCDLAQDLLTTGGADPAAQLDNKMHTIACKAAMKGGQKNQLPELERVAQAVMSGQVTHCPHGRPVAVELTKYQLEREFKRR